MNLYNEYEIFCIIPVYIYLNILIYIIYIFIGKEFRSPKCLERIANNRKYESPHNQRM